MILAAEIKTKIRMRKADYIHTYIDSTLMMMKAEEQNFFLQKTSSLFNSILPAAYS